MEHEKINLGGNTTLNLIKTNKFKNIIVLLSFKGIVSEENVTYLNLLARILPKATKKYPSMNLMESYLESNYGARLTAFSEIFGNINTLNFFSIFVDEKYLRKSDNLLEEQFKLLNDVLFNPFVSDNKFDEKYFKERKTNYVSYLKLLENDKGYQSSKGLKKMLNRLHPSSIMGVGYEEIAVNINNEDLYKKYQEVLTWPLDIYVLGDVRKEHITALIEKYLNVKNHETDFQFKPIHKYEDEEFEEKVEPLPFYQSQLLQAYYLDLDDNPKNRYIGLVFNTLLGGGTGSNKLYNVVREQHGLCYSIYSIFYWTYSLLYISAGISFANYEKATSLINEVITSIKNNDVSDDEFKMAKLICLSHIQTQFDSISSTLTFHIKDNLLGQVISKEEYEENVKNVTKEEVVEFAKKVKLIKQFLVKESKEGN
ncbi:TPA: insulinase family protein [bacterium]|nr:insulinase family protein [bacterium]